jgi:hypothetical protein
MAEPGVWGSGDGPIVAMDMDERDRLLLASQHAPHPGRVYDYYLGGNANYEVDRVFAKQRMADYPDLQWLAWQNRQCLRRMVRYLLHQGVRQFVDLGSGLPTQGNVHEIADRAAPGESRVVYVDADPIAFAMALIELEKHRNRHAAVCGDIADAARVWPAVLSTGVIDPAKPIAVLMAAVLPFVPDSADPVGVTTFYRDQLGPGSYLALTHGTYDDAPVDHIDRLRDMVRSYDDTTASVMVRSRVRITEFFGGWPLVDPGLVWTPLWQQPDDEEDADVSDRDPARSRVLAGMARNPA